MRFLFLCSMLFTTDYARNVLVMQHSLDRGIMFFTISITNQTWCCEGSCAGSFGNYMYV